MIFKYLEKSTSGKEFPSRYAYKYLERGMKIVGWLPPARDSTCYWIYMIWSGIVLFTMVLYLPPAIFGSYIIDFESFTPGDFLTSVQVAFNAACLALKILVLLPQMQLFRQAKELLDVMDKRCVRQEDRIEVHRCVILCNYTYMIYQGVYSSYATLTYLSSAITGTPPWGFYLPFVDYRDGIRSFWVASTVEYIIGSCAVFCDQMIDLFPVIFGVLLRTHLKLLIKRVERLRTAEAETEEQSHEELVHCIKDHKLLLEFCDVFRPIISGTIFAQFLVIGLGLGLSMMNLLFFSNLLTGLATSAFIVVLMIETFPFCYVCELIDEDCNMLTTAIFHSNWLDANKRYKSTLVYFLHQTQQSIKFIAGGIFPISMKTNIEVAKLAFTVVTFVKQMNIVEKLVKD
ncbi:odorant receptor 42b-like [Drosophila innubila]|uniref:odorant receptor 42b-like n=1 Tax=Drosophila innubila TaxID=198719 RepID=UPI00148CDA45|nr:odorant receptor 42b-like [Drosophila innubila]